MVFKFEVDKTDAKNDWYEDLIRRIIDAYDLALKHEIEANTVVLNGNRYGVLNKNGFIPTICGMKVEVKDLPDEYDFLVQKIVKPKKKTNLDHVREMPEKELAKFLYSGCDNIPREECDNHESCVECWVDWLRQEYTNV